MGGGVDFRCDRHVELAKAAGFDIGLYHWVDPTQSWTNQYNFLRDKILQHNPLVVGLDLEQWWADWTKWYKSIRGELANALVPRNTLAQVRDSFKVVRDLLLAEFGIIIPESRVWTYTADWFTDMYPGLSDAVVDTSTWVADYSLSRTIIYSEFGGNFKMTPTRWVEWVRQLTEEAMDDHDGVPILPNGHTDFTAWQVDSKVVPPGSPRYYDISIFKGTDAEYDELMGHTSSDPDPIPDPGGDPEPTPDKVVVKYTADIPIEFREV
jgi:hypothetical protein